MSNRKCKICESEESAELSMFECSQCGGHYCGKHQVVGSDVENGSCLECYAKRDNITGVYKECVRCGSKLQFLDGRETGICRNCRGSKSQGDKSESKTLRIDNFKMGPNFEKGNVELHWSVWSEETGWILLELDMGKLALEMIKKGDYKKL